MDQSIIVHRGDGSVHIVEGVMDWCIMVHGGDGSIYTSACRSVHSHMGVIGYFINTHTHTGIWVGPLLCMGVMDQSIHTWG